MTIKIVRDDDPMSPRDWDNLGVMACWHGRYNLGDIQPKESPQEWLAKQPKGSVILPLYLYDHSGITMRTSAFSCQWDSGQVGWIVATPDAIRKMYLRKRITKKIREQAIACLQSEVKTYDHYLTGSVWGYVVEKSNPCATCGHDDPQHEDSCFGFFGDTLEETGILDNLPRALHDEAREAWEQR